MNETDRSPPPPHDTEWDAGDLGCGDLVLHLHMRMKKLEAGHVLRIRADDPGAPADLPAWCGQTGHTLVAMDPPLYWIRRRESP